MVNNANKNNTYSILLGFYTAQARKIEPVIKQGINDTFIVYNKLWTKGMNLQTEQIRKLAKDNTIVSYFENAKTFGERVITIQRDTAHAIADSALKSVLSIIEASENLVK